MRHPALGLTLDVGHVMCVDEGKLDYHVLRWRDVLWNVHIEDMRRGVHDHLMFSEGDIDFSEVFAALRAIDYQGPVNVELSRHSHDAVEAARQAFEFLKRFD
jgi:sugar phosphate isomerase/epimerase